MTFILLSSRLTRAYKLLLPVAALLGLGIYVGLMVTQHWNLEFHAVVALFGCVLWLLFVLLVSIRIRHIAYNESFIRIRNYGRWVQIPASDYVLVDPGFPGFYQLRTSTGKHLFLVSYFGTLSTLIQPNDEPAAITTARRILAKPNPDFSSPCSPGRPAHRNRSSGCDKSFARNSLYPRLAPGPPHPAGLFCASSGAWCPSSEATAGDEQPRQLPELY
jgi:hypothetical protein